MSAIKRLERVLVIEDDLGLSAVIAKVVAGWGPPAEVVHSVTAARAALARDPDLIIIDVRLPDGDAFAVLETARHMSPRPAIVAISGRATAEEAFRLAQLGVRGYLAKPITAAELTRRVEETLEAPPDLTAQAVAAVGTRPLREVQDEVRTAMIDQALAKAGTRSGAARLLEVSRQAIQQIVRGRRNGLASRSQEGRPGAAS